MKAEPESRIEKGQDVKFSIDDLAAVTEPEPWSGVRNHSAKNNMLAMREGDLAFFYHSNSKVPGIVGICEIVGEAVPDETAFDQSHPYSDEKSTREKPTWYNVHVAFRQKFANPDKVSLKALKEQEELKDMQLLKMARLSVCMVKPVEWDFIMNLASETLAEERVEKDWVVVSQEDAQPGAQEEEQAVEEAVNAVADVIEGVAEAVAEQVGDVVAEEAGPEVAAVVADEVAHEVAEAVAEQVAETIEEEAGECFAFLRSRIRPPADVAWQRTPYTLPSHVCLRDLELNPSPLTPLKASGNNADMRNRASNIFPPAQITISEDLSFLPDAPALDDDDDEADELGELPATATSGAAKPSSRRASAGLTPAPKKKKSTSRGSSRAGSRARTLGPAELASTVEATGFIETITYEEGSTTIPDAGDVSLGEDLLSGFNATGDDINAAFLRTPSPERATIAGAINDLRGAESSQSANVGFFGRVSAFLSPGRDTEGEKVTEVEGEVAKAALGDEHEKTKESATLM
jgi:predicted RNA-binding protein with PUA-like domain